MSVVAVEPIPEIFATSNVVNLTSGSYASWAACFAANPTVRGFRCAFGDYRSWGDLMTITHGSAETRKFVVCGNPDNPPWKRPYQEQAIISQFLLGNSSGLPTDYWTLSGLTQQGGIGQSSIWMNSQHCIVDSMLIEGVSSPYAIRTRIGAQYCTVQRTVARNPGVTSDGTAFQLQVPSAGTAYGNRWLSCEAYNYNDSFQLTQGDAVITDVFDGTVVDNCDFYLDGKTYVQQPDGVYSPTENAFDIKGGSGSSLNPMKVTNNRMWGWRSTILSEGRGSDGAAMVVHNWAKNIDIEDNVILNSPLGIRLMQQLDDPAFPARNVTARRNFIHGMAKFCSIDTGQAFLYRLADRIENNVIAYCTSMSNFDALVGQVVYENNRGISTPLNTAQTEWVSGVGNRLVAPDECSPKRVTRRLLTGPETIELPQSDPDTPADHTPPHRCGTGGPIGRVIGGRYLRVG